jgi:hypothetical protein
MEPELLKHAPELLKGGAEIIKTGAEVAGAFKLTDIMKAILGPATGEVAERIHDSVRLYRFGRQLGCLKKAEKMAKDAGFTPKAVPVKILFPLLDGASLEENEDLHTMWAALLANAASPTHTGNIRPGFITILKQMAPDEVGLLKALSIKLLEIKCDILAEQPPRSCVVAKELIRDFGRQGEDESDTFVRFAVCFRLLQTLGLVEKKEQGISLTFLGQVFLSACEPPKTLTVND